MPKLPPALPPSITGPVTTAEARAAGLQPWQLRLVGLVPVFRDVWVPKASAGTLEGMAEAALHKLPAGAVLSHVTAARLRNLPVPDPKEGEPIHVLVRRPAHPRVKGIHAHLVRDLVRAEPLGGRLLVSPGARIWLDLAGSLGRDDLVVLGNAILFRRLATPREIDAELAVAGRRHGIRAAREAVPLLEPRCASPQETRTRLLLIDNGLMGFVVNVPVTDEAGGWICEPDFAWWRFKVAIQYQGDHHRTSAAQWKRDISGEDLLIERGWIVIRLVAFDLLPHRRALTAAKIRRALVSHGWSA